MSMIDDLNSSNKQRGLSPVVVRGNELAYMDEVFKGVNIRRVDIDKYVYNQAQVLTYSLFGNENMAYVVSLIIVNILSFQNSESVPSTKYGYLDIKNNSGFYIQEYLFGSKVDTRLAEAKRVILDIIINGRLVESYEDKLIIEYRELRMTAYLDYRNFAEYYERRLINTNVINQEILNLMEDVIGIREYEQPIIFAKECYSVYTGIKDLETEGTIIPKYDFVVSITLAYYLISLGYKNDELLRIVSDCRAWVDEREIKIISKELDSKGIVILGCLK